MFLAWHEQDMVHRHRAQERLVLRWRTLDHRIKLADVFVFEVCDFRTADGGKALKQKIITAGCSVSRHSIHGRESVTVHEWKVKIKWNQIMLCVQAWNIIEIKFYIVWWSERLCTIFSKLKKRTIATQLCVTEKKYNLAITKCKIWPTEIAELTFLTFQYIYFALRTEFWRMFNFCLATWLWSKLRPQTT